MRNYCSHGYNEPFPEGCSLLAGDKLPNNDRRLAALPEDRYIYVNGYRGWELLGDKASQVERAPPGRAPRTCGNCYRL